MVAPATPTQPPKPQRTRVDIFEVDRKKKLEANINPIRIDTLRIPYVARVDLRAQAAKEAAEARMGRVVLTVRHSEDQNVTVTFSKVVV